MKNLKLIIILLVTVIFLSPELASADVPYREVNTSKGKVIVGLNREKAYQTFGAPASKGDSLWYYTNPTEFFVSFAEKPTVLLFPDSCEGTVGVPLEFKAFLSLPDAEIQEITKEVQLVFDQPACARITGKGVITPKKTGKYSALAVYQEYLSNPLNLEIKEAEESGQKVKEQLLSIDLLPYRPVTTPEGAIDFLALGTFFDNDLNRYSVRDITKKAEWSSRLRPNLTWNQEESNRMYFLQKGRVEVLSRYQERESFLQRVEIKDQADLGLAKLKHLLVLPEMMAVLLNSNTNLRVFGTYYNNSVQELTQDVRWKIANPEILESNKNGYFFTRSVGVTEVTAIKDGIESLPVKVVVVNTSDQAAGAGSGSGPGQGGTTNYNMLGEIENNVDKLKKDFAVEKKELKSIQITPKLLEIGLGEEGKLSATGTYADGSSSDLTVLGEWGSLNSGIATVSGGNVACVSVGQTNVYVEFKGVRSEYASVVVGGPRLVSLLLTPENITIPRNGKAELKVQGNYYDQSQRDLTSLVTWGIAGEARVKIENGVVRPLKFGRSKVFAEHSLIKSNAADINVVLTLAWLLWLLAKIILALLLVILGIVTTLYLLADNKRKRLRALKSNPRELILELHENATQLVTIFGLRYDAYSFPLFYAELAKQKFLLESNVFLNFSVKFEEAKYSKHVLGDRDLAGVVNDYNNFFERLCKDKDQSRLLSLYRSCLALLHCRPIFVLSASEIGSAQ